MLEFYLDDRNCLERLVLSAISSIPYCDMFVESLTPIHYLNYYLYLFRYCLRLDLHLLLGLVFDASVPVIVRKKEEVR